jgi:hypothetical protein
MVGIFFCCPRWNLRVRRERPRHRAPNHFDEIASPHIGSPSPGQALYPLRQELDRGLKTIGPVQRRLLAHHKGRATRPP